MPIQALFLRKAYGHIIVGEVCGYVQSVFAAEVFTSVDVEFHLYDFLEAAEFEFSPVAHDFLAFAQLEFGAAAFFACGVIADGYDFKP